MMLGWKSVLCQREACLNAGNVSAVKVCTSIMSPNTAIISCITIQSIECKQELIQTCLQSSQVRRIYCGKTANWIWIPLGGEWGGSRDGRIRWVEIIEG